MRARLLLAALLAAGAVAVLARAEAVERNGLLAALSRLLKGDGERDGHIAAGAATGPVAGAVARAAARAAKDRGKDVVDAHATKDVGEIDKTGAAGHAVDGAVAVIHGALLFVGQDRVGLVQLGELLVRIGCIVMVGMKLDRLLPECALDLIGRGIAIDAEHLVVIPLVRHCVDPPPRFSLTHAAARDANALPVAPHPRRMRHAGAASRTA